MMPLCHFMKPCRITRPQLKVAKEFLQSGDKHRIGQRSLLACSSFAFHISRNERRSNSSTILILRNSVSQAMYPRQHSSVFSRQMSFQIPRTPVPKPSQIKSKFEDQSESMEEIADETVLHLLNQIYEADSPQGILNTYEKWQGRFNEVHSARALWCLSQVCERDGKDQELPQEGNLPATISRTELVKMDGFRNLCGKVLRDSPHMDNHLFLHTLDALKKLNVPESSSLVQTLLEQSKHRVNTFSANNLSYFAAILNKMPSSISLVNALLDGIALRIPEVLDDMMTAMTVITLLKVVGTRLSFQEQKKLVNRLTAIVSVNQDIDIYSIMNSLKALVGVKGHTKTYCQLATDLLKDDLSKFSQYDLVDLMNTLSQLHYYNEEFYQMVGDLITQNITETSESSQWSVNQLSHICRLYARWAHIHPDLLNAIAEYICKESNQQYSFHDLTHIIQPYAKFDYLPPNDLQFLDFMMSACNMGDLEMQDLGMCVAMATLVHYGRCLDRMMDFILDEGKCMMS